MTDAEQTSADKKKPVASAREIKALAHPLRLRILRLCGLHELTNKQLADRLGQDPGTVLYHVRQLLSTGFLEPAEVRTGAEWCAGEAVSFHGAVLESGHRTA